MNRTEKTVLFKVTRAAFAEHLYEGLTADRPRGGHYGLVEAARHWRSAKQDMGEYAQIECLSSCDTLSVLMHYLENHDYLSEQLEDYLAAHGIDLKTITCEQLDDMEYMEEMALAPGRTVERIIRTLYDKPYTDEFDAQGVIAALVDLEDMHFKFYGSKKEIA